MIKAVYTCVCDQCGASVGVVRIAHPVDAASPMVVPDFAIAYGQHLCQGCETVARLEAEKVHV